MSLRNAMNSGVSGLTAESRALGVVGDNVANVNTIGFKQSRAIFEDVLGGALGRDGSGAGVRLARTQQIFAQGSMLSTGQQTDLALSGDGFFVVRGTVDGVAGTYFTRAGQMTFREDGALVSSNGLELMGYGARPDGSFSTELSPVRLSTAALPPRATSTLNFTANLDASAQTPAAPWDPQNGAATSNFSTSITVYDSLGNAHSMDVYFRKSGPNTWEYHVTANGAEITGGTPGRKAEVATGTLTFNSSGALQAQATTAGGAVNFVGARPGQAIALNVGTPIATGGTGLDGITQFGSPSNLSAQSQDGFASGEFAGVRVDSDGVVRGVYSNGQTLAVSSLAVARFRSNDGLARAGHNLWSATRESGEAATGQSGAGGRAAIVGGTLEQSNVDITAQFVSLIAHQRSFQANSKTITTADQMQQELMNIKQ